MKLTTAATVSTGSPPRMRGKQSATFLCASVRRITPADAGKTPRSKSPQAMLRDHPRGCGENPRYSTQHFSRQGSPPRMRGKPAFPMRFPNIKRITPADAGKTDILPLSAFCYTDHPRGCGENCGQRRSLCAPPGSPPRMRGKLYGVCFGSGGLRITPAYAGKTRRRRAAHN